MEFNAGLKTIDINGKVTVAIPTTDPLFLDRINSAVDTLWDIQNEKVEAERAFEWYREKDARMREVINALFGMDVCTPLFEGISVFYVADGFPVWANLMFALVEEMDESLRKEQSNSQKRIEKYTKKYHK